MSDNKLPEGIRYFEKHANAPDFVIDSLVITIDDLNAFVQNNPDVLTEYNGKKQLKLFFDSPVLQIPAALTAYPVELSDDRKSLTYTYDVKSDGAGVAGLQAHHEIIGASGAIGQHPRAASKGFGKGLAGHGNPQFINIKISLYQPRRGAGATP